MPLQIQNQAAAAQRYLRWLLLKNFLRLFPIFFLLLYGVKWVDYPDNLALIADPFTTLAESDRQFLHSSPLPFFIGHLLHQLIPVRLAFWLTVIVGFAFLGSVFLALLRSYEQQSREIALIAAFSSPLLLVLLSWIGKADTYLIGAYLVLYLNQERPVVRALALAVMVLAHREIGTIIIALHSILERRMRLTDIAVLATSHLAIFGYHHILLSTPPASRADFTSTQPDIVLQHLKNPVIHLVLTFGWFWAFVVAYLAKKQSIELLLCIGVCFGFAFITVDFTRVFLLCSVPVMLFVAHPFTVRQIDLGPLIRYLPYLSLLQAQVWAYEHVKDSNNPSMFWALLHGSL